MIGNETELVNQAFDLSSVVEILIGGLLASILTTFINFNGMANVALKKEVNELLVLVDKISELATQYYTDGRPPDEKLILEFEINRAISNLGRKITFLKSTNSKNPFKKSFNFNMDLIVEFRNFTTGGDFQTAKSKIDHDKSTKINEMACSINDVLINSIE